MVDKELLAEYLEETVAGCEKDPSFVTGRNLVTYGMDLMTGAKSNDGFLAGIRVLGGAIKEDWPSGRKVHAKHLLTTLDSSTHIIRRLLQIVGPRSPYSTEIRTQAARIVALVACTGIRLEQFSASGVIECISSEFDPPGDEEAPDDERLSLLDASIVKQIKKDYQRLDLLEKWERIYYLYCDRQIPSSPEDFSLSSLIKPLTSLIKRLAQCLRRTFGSSGTDQRQNENIDQAALDDLLTEEAVKIIHQVAVDEENRRFMADTVVCKFAMAPLKLHRDNHDVILKKYWLQWLVAAVKETSSQRQILEDNQPAAHPAVTGIAIDNIKHLIRSIFYCVDCGAKQKRLGIQILLHLSLDMSVIMDSPCSIRRLTWILLLILRSTDDDHWKISSFTKQDDISTIKSLAGQKLPDVLLNLREGSAGKLDSVCAALRNLISGAFYEEDISNRIHATIILEALCVSYDLCYVYELEETLVNVAGNVVNDILILAQERQARAGGVEAVSERLRRALVSLCRIGYMERKGLRPKFEEIASNICEHQGMSFEYFKSLLV